MSEPEAKISRWQALPRLALRASRAGAAKTRSRSSSSPCSAIVMTLWIFTQQKASLPSWVAVRRRRLRPHHRRVRNRPGGHPGPGPGGRHRRHPGRQDHLGRPRRRPRGGRHGHRAQVHGADPPRRDPAAAAENQPQRHGRRGRTRQRRRARRRRLQLPARADRTEHQPRRLPRHPRRRHPPVPPAAARRRRAGDRRPRPASSRGAFRRLQPFAHYVADLNKAVAAAPRRARPA